ncbi:hypothetical protein F2Q68_00029409 [Brassica cretica]|uniref:Uncharacterized protein n=1 Tax=Brassica cretica TaxID=69181 RepID=A0A8S9G6L8_BRACR|nr:hypothetical protein F2Q68_00029409 [Brassica cretica]
MERSQELYINGDQNLEANLIDHEVNDSSSVPQTKNYKKWLRISIYQRIGFPVLVLIGLFASGEWKLLKREMRNYRLGKVSYVMTLSSAAVSSQVYTIGAVGLIFESSSVFSNTVTAVGLPIVPVVAVIVFHDKIDASKKFSIVLGF